MSSKIKISGYKIMWIFVFFDLPTEKPKHKRAYNLFRKGLLKDGFTMLQYSVYIRHTPSRENMEVHIKRIESILPKEGKVSIIEITDKQFGRIRHYWGADPIPPPKTPQQLQMF